MRYHSLTIKNGKNKIDKLGKIPGRISLLQLTRWKIKKEKEIEI